MFPAVKSGPLVLRPIDAACNTARHDLNRANLADFLRAVPGVQEVSIGHALIGDAVELGISETVRAYQRCIQSACGGGR